VTIVTVEFIAISLFLPMFLIVGQLDPLYVLLNSYEMHPTIKLIIRVVFTFIPVMNFVIFLGSMHLGVILLLHISKHTIRSLRKFESVYQVLMDFKSNSKRSHVHSQFLRKSIKHYSIIVVIISKIRQFLDFGAVSIMGNGLLIDVLANYVVIRIYGRIPLFLYLAIAIIALLVPIVMMAELPEAAQTLVSSTEVIRFFKGRVSQSRLQRKIVNSLIPAKIVVGPFFNVNKGTTATYVNTILNYTITAILSY